MGEFLSSMEEGREPETTWSAELKALWLCKKGNWTKAHDLAQNAGTRDGDWIHAHLHRIEGDLENAAYWYSRAGRKQSSESIEREWREITEEILSSTD
jgi:TPR repeat protein